MKNSIFLTGIALSILTPSIVMAQVDGCRRDGNGRIIGTAIGAGAGGVLGNVVAERGDKTEGAIIGAIVGAVIGNQVSKSDRGNCRTAYGFYDEQGRWHATGVSTSDARGYYDARGRWVSTRQGNYQNNDNGPNNPYRPGTGQYALNQMPTDIAGRISWMRAYIPNAVQSQHMNRTAAQYARPELTAIETQNRQFNRDGRFTQREGQIIQRRLDRLTIRFQQSERQARNN
jgi:hypothetical protein